MKNNLHGNEMKRKILLKTVSKILSNEKIFHSKGKWFSIACETFFIAYVIKVYKAPFNQIKSYAKRHV